MTVMTFAGGALRGTVSPPPSKSYTHRALFLSALANGRSTVTNALLSEDTKATVFAVQSMGAKVNLYGSTFVIGGGGLHAPAGPVNTLNSGTTMRIFTGLASQFRQPVTIDGDDSLRKRPMQDLLDALRQTGVRCSSAPGGRPPVTVCGPNSGGRVKIKGDISSQFITSLLLTAPLLTKDSVIEIEGKLVSAPYVDVTLAMMRLYGANADGHDQYFHVCGGAGYRPHDFRVPADWSSAAFPLVAGALGGEVTVEGLDLQDPQGDRQITRILQEMGAGVKTDGGRVTVTSAPLRPVSLDLGTMPDLFPVAAVLMCGTKGISTLYGAPQLHFKESDRIASTVAMIKALGGRAKATEDGCIIEGTGRLTGGHVVTLGDHRIMMAAAVASLICSGPVSVDNAACCAVSYPDFPAQMRELGMRVE
ncbi:MAG: 3-phosphoshikimate 1-carboxyvinyltransferase [Methanomethylophilus sp.]